MPSTTSTPGSADTLAVTQPADVEPALAALADRLGHRFADPGLLAQAVAHRSWCAEHPGTPSNERLEFLGDAVLGWVIADLVYRRYPEGSEGQLTEGRKAVVNAQVLAEVAAGLGVGEVLALGKGEAAAGGRARPSILADALEALFGAVYLDGGAERARAVIEPLLSARLDDAVRGVSGQDHKTLLQELAARRHSRPPQYLVREEGPDHAKTFHAEVRLDGTVVGAGSGRTKKQAEQAAASAAWSALGDGEPVTPAPVAEVPAAGERAAAVAP
jgi:ribonuclease-3